MRHQCPCQVIMPSAEHDAGALAMCRNWLPHDHNSKVVGGFTRRAWLATGVGEAPFGAVQLPAGRQPKPLMRPWYVQNNAPRALRRPFNCACSSRRWRKMMLLRHQASACASLPGSMIRHTSAHQSREDRYHGMASERHVLHQTAQAALHLPDHSPRLCLPL